MPITSQELLYNNETYGFSIYSVIPKDEKFQLVITDGLSAYGQEVNANNEGLEHIELYLCLPDYWNLKSKDWPVHWLNRIAQIPQKNQTWFGLGDTIPAGNPPQELDEQFNANHFIISKPILLAKLFEKEEWKAPFQPLAIIPIFQTEIDFKLRNSHTILFRKFEKEGVNELIDTYRKNTCRKRILGMF